MYCIRVTVVVCKITLVVLKHLQIQAPRQEDVIILHLYINKTLVLVPTSHFKHIMLNISNISSNRKPILSTCTSADQKRRLCPRLSSRICRSDKKISRYFSSIIRGSEKVHRRNTKVRENISTVSFPSLNVRERRIHINLKMFKLEAADRYCNSWSGQLIEYRWRDKTKIWHILRAIMSVYSMCVSKPWSSAYRFAPNTRGYLLPQLSLEINDYYSLQCALSPTDHRC